MRIALGIATGIAMTVLAYACIPDAGTIVAAIARHGLNGPVVARAQSAVAIHLIDPSSASFDFMRVVDTDMGATVCGRVNAKNRLGAYAGANGFVYLDILGVAAIDGGPDATRAFFRRYHAYCASDYVKPPPRTPEQILRDALRETPPGGGR
ncbi:hypothetical protein RA307_26090 [Xanthobacteraceae bacterium Astr-EGSB]|uniref:hypothetical protein n=1 Tax=Astrobacterium formosum TaxID=3069710 RepID=UPI0027ADF3FA|nr:hypothetical protein [Xanthobacteraceae bacterium Astr-EGSB]